MNKNEKSGKRAMLKRALVFFSLVVIVLSVWYVVTSLQAARKNRTARLELNVIQQIAERALKEKNYQQGMELLPYTDVSHQSCVRRQALYYIRSLMNRMILQYRDVKDVLQPLRNDPDEYVRTAVETIMYNRAGANRTKEKMGRTSSERPSPLKLEETQDSVPESPASN